MYFAIIAVLFAISAGLILTGLNYKKALPTIAGIIIAIASIIVFSLLNIWGEYLWFESIGFISRFWIAVKAKLVVSMIAGLFGLFYVLLLNFFHKGNGLAKAIGCTVAAFISAQWGYQNWDKILLYLNQAPTEVTDPIIGKSVSFYLFSLPVYDTIFSFVLTLTILSIAVMLLSRLLKLNIKQKELEIGSINFRQILTNRYIRNLFVHAGLIFIILAAGNYLNRFELMYSTLGAVHGPGWTDHHILLPVYTILAITALLFGVILILSPISYVRDVIARKFRISPPLAPLGYIAGFAATFAILSFIGIALLPGMLQWLRVEPNEITFEKPYIKNNIEYTRMGFKLNTVQKRSYPATEKLTQEMLNENKTMLNNVRLWDWRALDSVYKQFQEIRLYYEFADVDVDRYHINDSYRQTMVSAREMQTANLPAQSQTFVNKRFKYTHGYGMTMATVSDFTPEGLPNLLVKDIPPKSKYKSLEVRKPQIYYGELTDSHVIVNSSEKEFDYPAGENNKYTKYQGTGGVQISNLWRKFIFGWKFDGTRLFLSQYPKAESRIQFHRQIKDRVSTLAPFLNFDNDPYMVLSEGNIYWIIDCYTTSSSYPYSEPIYAAGAYGLNRGISASDAPYQFNGINYLRNSVKAVVDAYNGNVDFYVFEDEDPLIQTWQNIFPNMFKSRNEMPENLYEHIRYPSDMLLTQGLVYAKYHMTNPTVFYNQEDLWVRATEKYYNNVMPVEPYYIIWEQPGSDEPQFVLMMPFTPKNRQVLISWIAGMCDGENYGKFLAYKFPKEKRVLGTQQMETKIDQDSFLSGQLSLWDQRGSNVIRGNVLAIPIQDTLLYIEPIYLQAQTAAYPELRLVAVMHNDRLSYAETFDEALEGLISPQKKQAKEKIGMQISAQAQIPNLIKNANQEFEQYLQATGNKKFEEASKHLSNLQQYLQELIKKTEKQETAK
jgi:hypothetical protein